MKFLCSGVPAVLVLLLGSAHAAAAADRRAQAEAKPLLAAVWVEPGAAGGKEVVIAPDLEKLKAQGLTLEQVAKALQGRRFVAGKWNVSIDGKEVDLAKVAKLTVRELELAPFTVKLRDGRSVSITPDPKRVADYVVTGQYFEDCVRTALAEFPEADPAKVNVLGMIPVPGTLPHLTQDGGIHISLGEPLARFAKVELRSPLDRR